MPVAFVQSREYKPILGCLESDSFGVAQTASAPLSVNSYDDRLQRARICFERQQQKTLESLLPVPLLEQACDQKGASAAQVTGRQRLETIHKTLKALGLTFSNAQNEFINRMIAACAKLIFKDDLEANLADLLTELKITELHQELMALMPRRFGKTFVVAAMAVALISAIEGLEIGIFSTGRRASQKILEQIFWFMTKVGTFNIVKHNVETVWVQGPCGPTDLRKISSYPSNVRISPSFVFVCLRFLFEQPIGGGGW